MKLQPTHRGLLLPDQANGWPALIEWAPRLEVHTYSFPFLWFSKFTAVHGHGGFASISSMNSNFASVLKILNIDQELLRPLESFSEVPGWDSIMQMQLIVTVEAQVGFELSVEDIQDLSPARLFEIYGV